MRHDWVDVPLTLAEFGQGRKRWCRACGAIQQRESVQRWGRVVGYRWGPLVGRCLPSRRLPRASGPIKWTKRYGLLVSEDGRFTIRRFRGERNRYVLYSEPEMKPIHWGGLLREVKATAERNRREEATNG